MYFNGWNLRGIKFGGFVRETTFGGQWIFFGGNRVGKKRDAIGENLEIHAKN